CNRLLDTELVFGLLTNSYHIARSNLKRRDVDRAAIHHDRAVRNQLTRFSASSAETHAINHVIEAGFEQTQKVFTGCALLLGSSLVVVRELALKHAIDTTNFLLFAHLNAVIGQTAATGAMLARCSFGLALGLKRTDATFQKQVGAFAPRQFAGWAEISSH